MGPVDSAYPYAIGSHGSSVSGVSIFATGTITCLDCSPLRSQRSLLWVPGPGFGLTSLVYPFRECTNCSLPLVRLRPDSHSGCNSGCGLLLRRVGASVVECLHLWLGYG